MLLALLQTTAAANPFSVVMDKLRIGGIRKVPCPAEVKGMLALDAAKMHSIKEQMLLQMNQGLQGAASPMLMLPTHLTKLPTGKETGSFLALGAANFTTHFTCFTSVKVQILTLRQFPGARCLITRAPISLALLVQKYKR